MPVMIGTPYSWKFVVPPLCWGADTNMSVCTWLVSQTATGVSP
jgi:hypothetical protein